VRRQLTNVPERGGGDHFRRHHLRTQRTRPEESGWPSGPRLARVQAARVARLTGFEPRMWKCHITPPSLADLPDIRGVSPPITVPTWSRHASSAGCLYWEPERDSARSHDPSSPVVTLITRRWQEPAPWPARIRPHSGRLPNEERPTAPVQTRQGRDHPTVRRGR